MCECAHPVVCVQLFQYEALGLCPEGKGGDLIDSGRWIHNKTGDFCVLPVNSQQWPILRYSMVEGDTTTPVSICVAGYVYAGKQI